MVSIKDIGKLFVFVVGGIVAIIVGSLKSKLTTAQKELEQIQGLLEEEREAHKKTRQELMKIKSKTQ